MVAIHTHLVYKSSLFFKKKTVPNENKCDEYLHSVIIKQNRTNIMNGSQWYEYAYDCMKERTMLTEIPKSMLRRTSGTSVNHKQGSTYTQ